MKLMFKKNLLKSFTLAEILIVISIIGIITAITIPILITSYQKQLVSTRLEKFYETIHQAIILSEAENGPAKSWIYGEDNNANDTYNWFMKYIAPYYKYQDVFIGEQGVQVSLADGTWLFFWQYDHTMYIKFFWDNERRRMGGEAISLYVFLLPTYSSRNTDTYKFGPFDYNITTPGLRTSWINDPTYGCNSSSSTRIKFHCAGLIMLDNWSISNDVPWGMMSE